MSLKFLRILLIILGLASSNLLASSDEPRTITSTARITGNRLVIDVSDLLTNAQKEIVNSGFSTFTILAISTESIDLGDDIPERRVVCSVKYDTWEERYQMIRVEPAPVENSVVKDYGDWAKRCLVYEITNDEFVKKAKRLGTLSGILQVRQSSPQEAAKIKNWLVRQQSGFMQGLYAHMLGEFQFKGSIKLQIKIPSEQPVETERKVPPPPLPKGP